MGNFINMSDAKLVYYLEIPESWLTHRFLRNDGSLDTRFDVVVVSSAAAETSLEELFRACENHSNFLSVSFSNILIFCFFFASQQLTFILRHTLGIRELQITGIDLWYGLLANNIALVFTFGAA